MQIGDRFTYCDHGTLYDCLVVWTAGRTSPLLPTLYRPHGSSLGLQTNGRRAPRVVAPGSRAATAGMVLGPLRLAG